MKFVDVKNDVAFRKIFGNEKKTNILISFLNAILKLEGDRAIQEVSLKNPYQFPRVAGEKATIIDVGATDNVGRQFVIEMQVPNADGFDKRVQYYTCREYSMQIKSGDDYAKLKPTFFIGILDFNFFKSPDYMSHHIIVNGKTYEHKLKDMQFTFVELKKFNLKIDEIDTLSEKWIFFIKNAKDLKLIPGNVDDEGLKEAYKDAEKHSWNREELRQYDNAAIAIQDERGKLAKAIRTGKSEGRKIGKKEGRKIGKKEGKQETKLEVIQNCLKENMTTEVISKIVNIPVEELNEIIKKLNENQ